MKELEPTFGNQGLAARDEDPEPRVVYFSLGLSLGDIPLPSPCSYCGAAMQKELLNYETASESTVVSAGPTPGYGCTDCGDKAFPPRVFILLLEHAAKEAYRAGDRALARHLKQELTLHKTAAATSRG